MDNPFLRQRIFAQLQEGDTVTVEHHSDGYGLGCEYRESVTTGVIEEKTPGGLNIRDRGGILNYIPTCCMDGIRIDKEAVHG